MASAYGTLATGGIHHKPIFITKVIDRNGEVHLRGQEARQARVSSLDRVRRHERPQGRHHQRYGTARTSADLPRARPARARTTATSGSSATRRSSSPQSGWATPRSSTIYRERRAGLRRYGCCADLGRRSCARRSRANRRDFPTAKSPPYTTSKFSIPVSKPPKLVGLKLANAIGKLDGDTVQRQVRVLHATEGHGHRPEGSGTKLTLVVSKGPRPSSPSRSRPAATRAARQTPPGPL